MAPLVRGTVATVLRHLLVSLTLLTPWMPFDPANAAAAANAPAHGPDSGPVAAPAAPSPSLREITVKATREALQHKVFSYVTKITRSRVDGESLARWREPLCPQILGLPDEQRDFVGRRLAGTAASVGIAVAPPGCAVNLVVLISPEPQELLKEWAHDAAGPFADAWPARVDEFVNGKKPNRIWYLNAAVDADSGLDASDPAEQGMHTVHRSSRVVFARVLAISCVIVVIDTSRASGYQLGPMADYLSMVSLAQLDTDADVSTVPSILNLFDAPPGEARRTLTDWDRAFLKGLYATQQDSRSQRAQIVQKIMQTISP